MRLGSKLQWLVFVMLVLVGASWFGAGEGRGEDFRIDTEIFVDSEKKPRVEILTIFHSGHVYDFQLGNPEEITHFDPRRGVLNLLDVKSQRRASLTTHELLNAALSMQAAAAAQTQNPVFAEAARPVFEASSVDFQENKVDFTKVTFAGKQLHYVVTGQKARHPAAANDYRYFSDWSARLSSLRGGNLPAGARLEINDAIAKKGLLPTKVERVIQESRFGKKLVRSQHLVNWTLSQEDLKRIDRAGDCLAKFTLVSFEEFCQPAKVTARPAAGTKEQAQR